MSGTGSVRVLHVDDEPGFADVTAMHLERVDEDISVAAESSASDGLEHLRREPVDCVVSDHDMPGMNGLEFLRAVREEFPELPFILFTGKGNEEIASDAISAGVTEYLQKDVGTDQYAVLANRIRHAVDANRAKSALQESERQLSTLISNLPGMVYRCRNEPGWPMEFVSDGAAELVGYDADAIESGTVLWGSLVHDADGDRIDEQVQTSIAADEPFELSYRVETADGETRWVWERGRVVDTTTDGVAVLEGFITDITARKERERELRREREFTENLVDAIDDVFYLLNPDGELLRWNDTGREVTGYTDEELSTMTAFDLIPESYHDRLGTNVEQAVEAGHATFEAPLETSDGTRIPYEFRGSVIHDHEGDRLGVAGIARDITDRRERERELEQYRTLVENVGDPMYVLDSDGTIQMANDAMVDHLGYDREDIVGAEPTQFVPESDVERVTETLGRLIEAPDETWATVEMRTTDAEGTQTVNENKLAPLVDDGTFVGSVGVLRDVTARSQRERELERYETIVEAVGDPVYALDEDGVFTFVNEAFEPMTGYSPDELVGKHVGHIMTDADVARGDELIQELLADPDTDSGTLEMDVVTKWNERIPSENNLALLPAHDGSFNGTAGVIRDIHERQEREKRLAEFASVVSHDLRNPLNVVQGRLQLARETDDLTHVDAAADAADRMEQLIEDLLTLARQGDTVGAPEPIDVATAAEQAWVNVETVAATLDVVDTATVDADPERLRELLENLFRNSIEHGSADAYDSGSLGRRPTQRSVAHKGLTVTVGTLPEDADNASGFYVADNGPGIDPDERDDVFDRGYTTSADGTGFGLAIVEDIATAHGWTVEITESEAGGARFEFTTTRGAH